MKKAHRVAFIKEVIKLIEHKTPCLESYVEQQFEKYVRKCKHFDRDVNLDEFYDKMPDRYKVLRGKGQIGLPYDAELLEELRYDLEVQEPPPPKPSKEVPSKETPSKTNPDKKTK